MNPSMLSSIVNLRGRKAYYLPLLLLISIVSHFPFVLNGFGEIDATKIAVSVIDMLHHGSGAAFANFYFTDVVPLYILYLKWTMKLLKYQYSYLPVVMNYTNAVFGTLTVIPAYFLINRLFRNATIAFCSVFALMFAPSFYQSSIMGFPHMIAFFFLLVSLCFYLSGLDLNRNGQAYFRMFLACIFLTVAFLFKSDYVLASGTYFGFLFIRKIKDKIKITSAFLITFVSGVLFLLFRNLILGPSSGTTMSKAGMANWYDFSIAIPKSLDYLILQTEPIYYGAGIVTFCLLIISVLYYFIKRRLDILIFMISWTAIPTLFWLVLIGNNARHNMITTLPFLVIIVSFLYEKVPKLVMVLTAAFIVGNFLVTPPSFSILRPSGNVFKSTILLKERMNTFQSTAREIADIDEDNIVVLGYFHNPAVIYEVMRSDPSYTAFKVGREDYRIQAGGKEYVFIYFVIEPDEKIEEEIVKPINKYGLNNHLFVSATYDLKPLEKLGLKTRTLNIIKRSTL
jgi:hypothetical protein